jgi:hypothetical protein
MRKVLNKLFNAMTCLMRYTEPGIDATTDASCCVTAACGLPARANGLRNVSRRLSDRLMLFVLCCSLCRPRLRFLVVTVDEDLQNTMCPAIDRVLRPWLWQFWLC